LPFKVDGSPRILLSLATGIEAHPTARSLKTGNIWERAHLHLKDAQAAVFGPSKLLQPINKLLEATIGETERILARHLNETMQFAVKEAKEKVPRAILRGIETHFTVGGQTKVPTDAMGPRLSHLMPITQDDSPPSRLEALDDLDNEFWFRRQPTQAALRRPELTLRVRDKAWFSWPEWVKHRAIPIGDGMISNMMRELRIEMRRLQRVVIEDAIKRLDNDVLRKLALYIVDYEDLYHPDRARSWSRKMKLDVHATTTSWARLRIRSLEFELVDMIYWVVKSLLNGYFEAPIPRQAPLIDDFHNKLYTLDGQQYVLTQEDVRADEKPVVSPTPAPAQQQQQRPRTPDAIPVSVSEPILRSGGRRPLQREPSVMAGRVKHAGQ